MKSSASGKLTKLFNKTISTVSPLYFRAKVQKKISFPSVLLAFELELRHNRTKKVIRQSRNHFQAFSAAELRHNQSIGCPIKMFHPSFKEPRWHRRMGAFLSGTSKSSFGPDADLGPTKNCSVLTRVTSETLCKLMIMFFLLFFIH